MDIEELQQRQGLAEVDILALGITFTVYHDGQGTDRAWPMDIVPRVIAASEWARIELCGAELHYELPERRTDCAGIIISLARQERPDPSTYDAPEVVWRLDKRHHAGLIVASRDADRIEQLLDEYSRRFYEDFVTTMPAPETLR